MTVIYGPTLGGSPGPFLLAEHELFHPENVGSPLKSGGGPGPFPTLAMLWQRWGSLKGETLEHPPPQPSIFFWAGLAQTTLESRIFLPWGLEGR